MYSGELHDNRPATPGKPSKSHKGDKRNSPAPKRAEVFAYSLPVDASLFGQLRIRCWAEDDERPSRFSAPVSLPRHKGSPDIDIKLRMVIDLRADYFGKLVQHVTSGKPIAYRIGNQAGLNIWGGDSPPPPPPPTAKEKAMGNVMAPVPYDVPRLPGSLPGIDECGGSLARFYRECGVPGGGGGRMFGLRIDHILHAICGTPTTDGESSPSRTLAGLREPLMALCEVAYADALLPLFDEVETCQSDWALVDEKVFGVVKRVSVHRAYYEAAEDHVKNILKVMLEIFETARQCLPEQTLPFHMTHMDYSKEVKQRLKAELAETLKLMSWNLSTELLKMQLAVRKVTPAVEPAEADALEPSQADDVKVKQVEVDAKKPSDSAVKPGPLLKRAKTAPSRTFLQRAATASNLDQVKQGSTDDGEMMRSNHRFAKAIAKSAPAMSLLSDIHERSKEAQERVQAQMQEAVAALVRARRAGNKLLRLVETARTQKNEAELLAAAKAGQEEQERRLAQIREKGQALLEADEAQEAKNAEKKKALQRKLVAATRAAGGGRDLQLLMHERKRVAFWDAPYEWTPYRQSILELAQQPNRADWLPSGLLSAMRIGLPPPSKSRPTEACQRPAKQQTDLDVFLRSCQEEMKDRERMRSMLPSRTAAWGINASVARTLPVQRPQSARKWRKAPAPPISRGATTHRPAPMRAPPNLQIYERYEAFVPSPWKSARERVPTLWKIH